MKEKQEFSSCRYKWCHYIKWLGQVNLHLCHQLHKKFDVIMYLVFFSMLLVIISLWFFFCFSECFFLLANVELQTTCCIMTIKHIYIYNVFIFFKIFFHRNQQNKSIEIRSCVWAHWHIKWFLLVRSSVFHLCFKMHIHSLIVGVEIDVL